MAFETIDSWTVERRWELPLSTLWWSPRVSANIPFQAQIEKMPSVVLAIGLNSAFLYFLVSSAFNIEWEKPAESSTALEAVMTMVDLGSISNDPKSQLQHGGSGRLLPAKSPPSELDATIETELPPEWSVGRIRVARTVPMDVDPSAGAGTIRGSSVGAGSSDGVYDPYAGASPNRRKRKNADSRLVRMPVSRQVAGVDHQAFEQWVEKLRNRLPRARGTIELAVSTGNEGKITSAKLVGGNASPQIKLFVRNAAMGQWLAKKNMDELVLPKIHLG